MTAEDELHDGVGQHVTAARKLAGLTQQQLDRRAHVSRSLVKQVREIVVTMAEQDRRRSASLAGFARLAGIRI